MKRPVGVTLTSVVLGLCAALQLLFAAVMGFTALVVRHTPAVPTASAYPPGGVVPSQNLISIVSGLFAIFLSVFAAWAITTLVGLLRLRKWARYSVLVIGGCLAGLGLLSMLGVTFAAFIVPSLPFPPNVPPHTMQIALIFEAVVFGIFAAIGIWWLVYFNLRSTSAAFLPAIPVGYEPAYILDPSLPPPPPGSVPTYLPPSSYPAPSRLTLMPTPVIVVACLLVVGGLSCFACMFLPYPAFLFGQIIPLPYSRAVYIGLGVWSGALGAGLFRLNNQFRIATLAFLGIWGAHLAMILTPWYRGRFATYNNLLYGQMHMPIPSTALFTGGLLSFSGIVGILFYGAMAWILHHYRAAFITTRTLRDSHAAG